MVIRGLILQIMVTAIYNHYNFPIFAFFAFMAKIML